LGRGSVGKRLNDELLFSLTNHALIVVSKFLEAWDDFGGLAKAHPQIVPLRRALSPLIDRILVWDGLREYRNTILAHAYLGKRGELVDPWHLHDAHRVPTYHAEIILLMHLVHLAVCAIMVAFEEVYWPLRPLLASGLPTPDPGPGIQAGTEISKSLQELAPEIDKRLAEIGVVVTGRVAKEFKSAITVGPQPL
jgi:hypothetical protein